MTRAFPQPVFAILIFSSAHAQATERFPISTSATISTLPALGNDETV
jgi:hypothetical protein